MEAVTFIFYAAAKFAAYCVWCLAGLRILAPARATLRGSLKYGSLRWLLGLGFGITAAIALGPISPDSVARLYFSVYAPLRIVEWTIMAIAMQHERATLRSSRVWLWVLGGIVVSFASDLASPEGMVGRFCVGRCLC